jgi:hypothetical protein
METDKKNFDVELVIFPTDKYYSYLRKYLNEKTYTNPVFVGYNYDEALICNVSTYETLDNELRLKCALEYIKKYSNDNPNAVIKIFLYTPDISYYYDDINLHGYLVTFIVFDR